MVKDHRYQVFITCFYETLIALKKKKKKGELGANLSIDECT